MSRFETVIESTCQRDAPPNGGPAPASSSPTARSAAPDDRRKARLKRIDEYEVQGLKNPIPFAATLAMVQADLFRAAHVTGPRMIEALSNIEPSPEKLRQIDRAIATHLGVVRQIDRLAQLDLRLIEARQKADALTSKLRQDPLRGPIDDPDPPISGSEESVKRAPDETMPPNLTLEPAKSSQPPQVDTAIRV